MRCLGVKSVIRVSDYKLMNITDPYLSKNKSSMLKNKRVRTIFTPEQLERLEAEFERQQYMVRTETTLYVEHIAYSRSRYLPGWTRTTLPGTHTSVNRSTSKSLVSKPSNKMA